MYLPSLGLYFPQMYSVPVTFMEVRYVTRFVWRNWLSILLGFAGLGYSAAILISGRWFPPFGELGQSAPRVIMVPLMISSGIFLGSSVVHHSLTKKQDHFLDLAWLGFLVLFVFLIVIFLP